jgi:hypothetical protein
MKLADLPRATNRALIDSLFNGNPPYSEADAKRDNITTNVNFLDSTRLAHDMRRQYSNAFLKPGNFFKVRVDFGPTHRRADYGSIITEEINRQLKRGRSAQQYRECKRNKFAQTVIHGIGPVVWKDKELWCPSMHQMCDVLIPSGTLLTMENLGHAGIYKRFTAAELMKLTSGPRIDPAWKKPVVDAAIKWALKDHGQTTSANDTLSPEIIQERWKADRGFYAIDAIPTINAYDFYYFDDEDEDQGWHRCIVLDTPADSGGMDTRIPDTQGQFLYKSKVKTKYADRLSEIIHFQFADGSVVAPFRYHSVRSLGFLLYAVCHLQNRLRCKFNDSVFESLLNYFRVANPDDADRLQKLDLVNMGLIPEGLQFVPRQDRWEVDHQLVQSAFGLNRQTMADNSTAFTQDFGSNINSPDKTATQITAEVNASTALVGSMLNEAYAYEEFEYREICRRFCIPNSKDPDVRDFRLRCLKRGIPEACLDVAFWEVSAERVIGAGNKQLEGAMVQSLMAQINRYDPDAQRQIMKLYTLAATDDAAMTEILVPPQQNLVTDSIHDAQLSAAPLMMGMLMGLKQGVNHGEYAATLIGALNLEIQKVNANEGVTTQENIAGMQNLAGMSIEGQPIEGNGAANHIAVIAQSEDPNDKALVKQLNDELSKLLNEIRALQQRLQESQQQAQAQSGQPPIDPAALVKLQGQVMLQEAKAKALEASTAQKLQMKQESHDQKMRQSEQSAELRAADQLRQSQTQVAIKDIELAGDLERQAMTPEKTPAA